MALDSTGLLLTRYGFTLRPEFTGFDAQYLRTVSALLSFMLYVPFIKIGFMEGLKSLTNTEKGVIFLRGKL